MPLEDQEKLLVHCHAGKGKKVWLDADTFMKHKVTIPEKYAYLLGDASGCKRTQKIPLWIVFSLVQGNPG